MTFIQYDPSKKCFELKNAENYEFRKKDSKQAYDPSKYFGF